MFRTWKDTGRKWRSNRETMYVLSEDLPFSVQVRAKNMPLRALFVCSPTTMSFLGSASRDTSSLCCDWSTPDARCDQNQSAISRLHCETSQITQLLRCLAKVRSSLGTVHKPANLNPVSRVQN